MSSPPPTKPPTSTPTSTSDPPSSPGFPPIPAGNLTAKGIDTTNTTFKTSNLRTPVSDLPFPHPKWHVRPATGQIYEVVSPIFEAYDPVSGYVDRAESIEGDEAGDMAYYGRNLRLRPVGDGWLYSNETGKGWTGRVEWPESRERTSIAREARFIARERERRDEVGGAK